MNYIKLFEAVGLEKFKEDFEKFKNDINFYRNIEEVNYILDELKDDLYDKITFDKYNQSGKYSILNLEYKVKVNRKLNINLSYYDNLIINNFKLSSDNERYFYGFLEKLKFVTNLNLKSNIIISLINTPITESEKIANILKGYINIFNKFDMKIRLSNRDTEYIGDDIKGFLEDYCFTSAWNSEYADQVTILMIFKKIDMDPVRKDLDISEFSDSLISDFKDFCNKYNINTEEKKQELKNLILKYGEEQRGN